MKTDDLNLDREIVETETKLKQLYDKRTNRSKLTSEHRVAIEIHGLLCRSDHAQDCGWYYEVDNKTDIHDWSRYAHAEALKKATSVVKAVGEEAALKFIAAIKEAK